MATRVRRTLITTALAAAALLSGCATTYDSAGNTYYSVWPFIGSRNPDLQLNYPVEDPKHLRLSRDPDPLDWFSPDPPVDPRVWSPYSQIDTNPQARIAAQRDDAHCANRCNTQEAGVLLALRADAGDVRRTASR